MTKFIYNPSPIYTTLFKGGSVEIKAKSYITVQDWEVEAVYDSARISKQIEVYDKESDIPTLTPTSSESIVVVSKPPVVVGLTEEELKKELENKSTKPERGTGSVTQIGQPVTEIITSGDALDEPASETEVPESDGKPKAKRGPKAKSEKIGS